MLGVEMMEGGNSRLTVNGSCSPAGALETGKGILILGCLARFVIVDRFAGRGLRSFGGTDEGNDHDEAQGVQARRS